MKFSIKRKISFIVFILLFIAYFILTDPDNKLISGIPFGVDLVLTIGIFIIATTAIVIVEFIPDFIVDVIYGKESILVDKAKEDSIGAGSALVAKSIRILGYCIITAAAIVAYNLR